MRRKISLLLMISALFSFGPMAHAALSPVSVSVLPPVQFPPADFDVTGVRVSALWGHHRSIYGFDFGVLGNITENTFTGLAVSGLFNMTHGTTTAIGLQVAGLANINTNKTTVVGLQFAAINSNVASASVWGLELALGNLATFTEVYGIQAGVFNKAQDIYGLQIGLVNMTENLHGLQIGLINFNHKGLFAVAPILNVGF